MLPPSCLRTRRATAQCLLDVLRVRHAAHSTHSTVACPVTWTAPTTSRDRGSCCGVPVHRRTAITALQKAAFVRAANQRRSEPVNVVARAAFGARCRRQHLTSRSPNRSPLVVVYRGTPWGELSRAIDLRSATRHARTVRRRCSSRSTLVVVYAGVVACHRLSISHGHPNATP